jgi:hypothetical protein
MKGNRAEETYVLGICEYTSALPGAASGVCCCMKYVVCTRNASRRIGYESASKFVISHGRFHFFWKFFVAAHLASEKEGTVGKGNANVRRNNTQSPHCPLSLSESRLRNPSRRQPEPHVCLDNRHRAAVLVLVPFVVPASCHFASLIQSQLEWRERG